MQQIYMQSDGHFEVFTTVFSPEACRARSKYRPRETDKVVAAVNYRPHWPDELNLFQGDVIQVLYRDEPSWWYGRLQNGSEGYFPSVCVTKLNQRDDHEPTKANLISLRRHSSKGAAPDDQCCSSGCSTPKVPRHRKEGLFRGLAHEASSGSAHSSPSLLHRLLSKGNRRRSDTQAPDSTDGSTNVAFEPD